MTQPTDQLIAEIMQGEAQPVAQDIRWYLASKLKCWHRLSGEESDQLAELFETHPPTPKLVTAGDVTPKMIALFENAASDFAVLSVEDFCHAVNAYNGLTLEASK